MKFEVLQSFLELIMQHLVVTVTPNERKTINVKPKTTQNGIPKLIYAVKFFD